MDARPDEVEPHALVERVNLVLRRDEIGDLGSREVVHLVVQDVAVRAVGQGFLAIGNRLVIRVGRLQLGQLLLQPVGAVVPGAVDFIPFAIELDDSPRMVFGLGFGAAALADQHRCFDARLLEQVHVRLRIAIADRGVRRAGTVLHQGAVCGVGEVARRAARRRLVVVVGDHVDELVVDRQGYFGIGFIEVDVVEEVLHGIVERRHFRLVVLIGLVQRHVERAIVDAGEQVGLEAVVRPEEFGMVVEHRKRGQGERRRHVFGCGARAYVSGNEAVFGRGVFHQIHDGIIEVLGIAAELGVVIELGSFVDEERILGGRRVRADGAFSLFGLARRILLGVVHDDGLQAALHARLQRDGRRGGVELRRRCVLARCGPFCRRFRAGLARCVVARAACNGECGNERECEHHRPYGFLHGSPLEHADCHVGHSTWSWVSALPESDAGSGSGSESDAESAPVVKFSP